jgi:hypothetical protein
VAVRGLFLFNDLHSRLFHVPLKACRPASAFEIPVKISHCGVYAITTTVDRSAKSEKDL